ncbi:hypothetical protein KPATCC21470_7491 [Kitasatospora purpeofusca]
MNSMESDRRGEVIPMIKKSTKRYSSAASTAKG